MGLFRGEMLSFLLLTKWRGYQHPVDNSFTLYKWLKFSRFENY